MSSTLGPVNQETAPLRRKIATSLRNAIEQGVLKQGDRLVEKRLCEDLGVSRTSLREALRELESEGLITNRPNRGLVIAHITRSEATNIYRVRGALEGLAAEQFTELANDEDMAQLQKHLERIIEARQTDDMKAISTSKKEFYDCLCKGAGNPVAMEILRRLNSRTSQLRWASLSQADRLRESTTEIQEIVACIIRREPKAAGESARHHINNALTSALTCTTFHDDPADE